VGPSRDPAHRDDTWVVWAIVGVEVDAGWRVL
jgi:hypothetical protein